MSYYGNLINESFKENKFNQNPIEYIEMHIDSLIVKYFPSIFYNKGYIQYYKNRFNKDQIKSDKDNNIAGAICTNKEKDSKYILEIKNSILKSKIYGNYINSSNSIIISKDKYIYTNILYFNDYDKFIKNITFESIESKIKNFECLLKPIYEKYKLEAKVYQQELNKLYSEYNNLIKQNKLDEAKQIIDKIYNFTGEESRKEYLLKQISYIEKENNRIKEIKDNSGNTIIKYNDEINLYEFIKKINNNTVYLSNNEIIKNDNLLNYLNNFNKDFELFTKMISSNKYKEICKELLESYFSDLKDIISEDKIKKFGNIKSNISKCQLNNELFYNPIDRSIRFNVTISLIDYTGDATCEMNIKENGYIVKIIDIYCD